jgi:hypothetical protein
MLADYVRGLDTTRPISSALNFVFGKWTDTDGYYSALDIGGYNYNLKGSSTVDDNACRSIQSGLRRESVVAAKPRVAAPGHPAHHAGLAV